MLLSFKCILISCACILKFNIFFFAMGHFLIGPLEKNHDVFILLIHCHFLWWQYSRNILNAHFASLHGLNRMFIPNFVHHHFWLKLLQKLRYLLWFILINLISYDASQSTNVSIFFELFFGNGPFGWSIKSLHLPIRNHIFFIVLHNHIKPYKCICFTIWHDIK